MPTNARVRRSLDVQRLADAVSKPGIDPRSWNTAARVDDNPDAIRWDPQIGWLVDVTPYGGGLEGEAETTCRVASPLAAQGAVEAIPIERACEVIVDVLDGDLESNPVISGRVNNADDCFVPLTVTGVPINGEVPISVPNPLPGSAWFVTVSPFDTELKNSPYNRAEQYAGKRLVQADVQIIEADQDEDGVFLGSRSASEPFVLGDAYTEALGAYVDAVDDYALALTGPIDGIAPGVGTSSAAALKAAGVALKESLKEALSLKIKGE